MFVPNESEKINSLFGLRSLSVKPGKQEYKIKASSYGISSCITAPKNDSKIFVRSGACWYCDDVSHELTGCKSFLSKSVKERSSFVKRP